MKIDLPLTIGDIFFFVEKPCFTCRDGYENCEYGCDRWREDSVCVGTVDKIIIMKDNTVCFKDEAHFGDTLFTFKDNCKYAHTAFWYKSGAERELKEIKRKRGKK